MSNSVKNNKKGVIVLGGHVQGLGIIRIYGENGIPGVVADTTRKNLARHSKYCVRFFRYNNFELVPFLLELGEKGLYDDWMIIPTNDLQVKQLSKNKKLLEKYFRISTDDWEVIEKVFNKKITYQLMEKLGIDIPGSWYPRYIDDVMEQQFPYPCIIKPAVMYSFYRKAGKKVFLCRNRYELISNYKKALKIIPSEEIIIQEVIPGSNEDQYSACFMYDRNRPLISLIARRKRQHPLKFGNATTFAETVNIPLLLENSKKILNAIGYRGVCEVEFKFDERDQKYKFFEVNPRTWKWHIISKKSDSPFLISLYHSVYGLGPVIKNDWREATFKHFLTDAPTVVKMIFKGIYVKSGVGNLQHAVWDPEDLMPGLFEVVYLPYNIVSR